MFRSSIVLVLLINLFISCSADSDDPVSVSSSPCPDIEYSNISCVSNLIEDPTENGFKSYYHSNGMLKSEGNLTLGIPNGFWKFFNTDGNLIMEGNYTQGKLNGFWKVFWENGNLREEGQYNTCKKTGFWRFFHENKNHKVKHQGNFSNDKRINSWQSYSSDGDLLFEGECND